MHFRNDLFQGGIRPLAGREFPQGPGDEDGLLHDCHEADMRMRFHRLLDDNKSATSCQ